MFIVPSCRGEPDGRKCRELYDLLLDFITNRTIVLPTLCADLPGLSSSSGSCGVDVDAPLPEPASADEEAEASSVCLFPTLMGRKFIFALLFFSYRGFNPCSYKNILRGFDTWAPRHQ